MKHHSFSPRAGAAAAVAGMAMLLAGGTATGAMAAVTSVSVQSAAQSTPTGPGAPTGLTATPGNGTATLSWSAPSSDDGSSIVWYVIQAGTSDDILEMVSGHTVTLAGLTNGTTYTFRVHAQDATGEDGSAATVQVTPVLRGFGSATGTAPGAPTGLKTDYGDGVIVLEWSPPASAGSSPVTGYRVYMGSSPSFTAAQEFTVTGTSFRLTDAVNGSGYFIKVTAVNAAGEGPATSAPLVIPAPHITHTPTGLTARAGHGKVTLSWSPPAGGLMNGDGYRIYMSTSPGHEGSTPYVAHLIEGTSYTIAPLRDGTRYYFRVALLDHFNGPSAQSAEVSAVTWAGTGSGTGPGPSSSVGGNNGDQGNNATTPGGNGGVVPQPTTPTQPGQEPGQPGVSSGSSAGLIIGLAALSLAGAGGAVAIVLIQRRRRGRGYPAVPAPRHPYDDEPAGQFGRTDQSGREQELNGPRYR
jgi:hypothetical protein